MDNRVYKSYACETVRCGGVMCVDVCGGDVCILCNQVELSLCECT